MTASSENGIYINGKQQIIEMLQYMEESERTKLLNNIKLRNSSMARELQEKSLSFKDLFRLPTEHLGSILKHSNPAILGLAIYDLSPELQRKALSSIPRNLAEQAFNIMSKDLRSKRTECKRAQDKITQTAIELSKRNLVQF